jgi:mono/diheme cytochrome c family protein
MKIQNLILSFAIAISTITVSFAQDGEQLFKTTCAACHTVGKGKLVGPDLKDVQNRHEKSWILKWVKSSQTLVKAGDAQAVKLFSDNNRIPMPDQALTDDQINSILGFIVTKSTESASAKTEATSAASASGNSSQVSVASDSPKAGNLLTIFSFTEYLLMGLLCLLFIVIWVLAKSIKSLSKQLADKISTGTN